MMTSTAVLVVPFSVYFTLTTSPTFTYSVITGGFLSVFSAAVLRLAPVALTWVSLSTVNVNSAPLAFRVRDSAVTAETVPVAVDPLSAPGLAGLSCAKAGDESRSIPRTTIVKRFIPNLLLLSHT